MGDPELRSDESVLLRTQGIYVKSIPFEGILTNKRIILVDRTTNLLPQKEIPLVTLKDFQAGENAIRDQIITLSVLAKTGETRQMILTFSRQTGGNRIKERDDWMRALKQNTSSSFEQVIRKVIPGVGPAPGKSPRTGSPRIEIISSPVSPDIPSPEKTAVKKERDDTAPVKKIIRTGPSPPSSSPAAQEIDASPSGLGTYCSRCGNRVPDSSKFCNRCGSQIVVPGSVAASAIPKPLVHQPAAGVQATGDVQLIDQDVPKGEPLTVHLPANTPSSSPRAVPPQPEILREQNSDVILPGAISSWSDSDIPGPDEKAEPARPVIINSPSSEPIPPPGKPHVPQKPWDGHGFTLSKKTVLGIIAIIIIVAILLGAYFLYPMISDSDGVNPDNGTALSAASTNTTKSGMAATPVGTRKPATTATYRPGPGNSGSRVGL